MQILANWEEFASIKTWKKGLKYNSYRNQLAPRAEEVIRLTMPLFLEYAHPKTPDDLIEEALNGKETVKARLSDFMTWLIEVKKKNYNQAVNYSYSIIRGFYSHNDINTQKIRSPKLQPTEVSTTDDNFPMFDIIRSEVNGLPVAKKQLRRNFLADYLRCMSLRDRVAYQCQLSSGLDDGDLFKLTLATIRYQDPNEKRLFIRNFRNKNGEIINTFFSIEATKEIRSYERNYRKNGEDSDPIFVLSTSALRRERTKTNNGKFNKKTNEVTYDSIDPKHYAQSCRIAAEKLEQLLSTKNQPIRFLQPHKQSPLRPKRTRKIFSDACDDAGIPVDVKRVFMGKKDAANKPYEGKGRQDLEIYYERVEPNLTIFSEPIPKSTKEKDLQAQIDEITKFLQLQDTKPQNNN